MTPEAALAYAREHALEIAAAVNRGDQDARYIAAAHLMLTSAPDNVQAQTILITSVLAYRKQHEAAI